MWLFGRSTWLVLPTKCSANSQTYFWGFLYYNKWWAAATNWLRWQDRNPSRKLIVPILGTRSLWKCCVATAILVEVHPQLLSSTVLWNKVQDVMYYSAMLSVLCPYQDLSQGYAFVSLHQVHYKRRSRQWICQSYPLDNSLRKWSRVQNTTALDLPRQHQTITKANLRLMPSCRVRSQCEMRKCSVGKWINSKLDCPVV